MRTLAKPKNLKDQVLVITGASSGIGLATAEMAAKAGAKVVLSSFDEEALKIVTEDIRKKNGDVMCFVADVAKEEDLKALAQFAVEKYGRIDTWINNAGIHIFGKIEEVELEDARRVFDVDFWGVVYGSRIALPYLEQTKGTLINIGSVLSSHSVPLQGYYGASKHAVKGYTHALRMELEKNNTPVAVCLIKPSAIHTPIVVHSKNIMSERAQLPPPHYAPEVAARGILSAAQTPRRELVIGGFGKLGIWGEKFGPSVADILMKSILFGLQKAKGPHREKDALFEPVGDPPRKRDREDRFVREHSSYTWATTHPWLTALGGLAVVAASKLYLDKKKDEQTWV